MIANLASLVIAIVILPFVWLMRAVVWIAERLRIEPFYLATSMLLLPLWISYLVEAVISIREGDVPIGELLLVVFGAVYLLYVVLLVILGFTGSDEGEHVEAEGESDDRR